MFDLLPVSEASLYHLAAQSQLKSQAGSTSP